MPPISAGIKTSAAGSRLVVTHIASEYICIKLNKFSNKQQPIAVPALESVYKRPVRG